MVYNHQGNGSPGGKVPGGGKERDPQERASLVIAFVAIGAFTLAGFLIAPTIRAGSNGEDRPSASDSAVPRPSAGTPGPPLASRVPPESPAITEPDVQITTASDAPASPGRSVSSTESSTAGAPASSRFASPERASRGTAARSASEAGGGAGRLSIPAKAARDPLTRRRQPRVAVGAIRETERPLPPDEIYYARPREQDQADEAGGGQHAEERGDTLLGEWNGIHTGRPATLVIDRVRGDRIRGVLSVQTGGSTIETGVAGRISDDGRIQWSETRVRRGDPDAWDLGVNDGRVRNARMEGRGRDRRGRAYTWSFSR